MRYDTKIREEELKHRVTADWFAAYDCTHDIGNIDFICPPAGRHVRTVGATRGRNDEK